MIYSLYKIIGDGPNRMIILKDDADKDTIIPVRLVISIEEPKKNPTKHYLCGMFVTTGCYEVSIPARALAYAICQDGEYTH